MSDLHFLRKDDFPLAKIGKEQPGSNPKKIYFNPFAYALNNENMNKYCWTCLEDIENKQKVKCEGCNVARYCRNVCKEKGKMDHKVECKGLKTNSSLSVEARFLARIVVRVKDIRDGEDKRTPHFYENRTSKRVIDDLWHNKEHVANDKYAMEKFNKIWNDVTMYCSEKHLLSKDDAFEYHCRSISNRHTLCDAAYTSEIGKGLYLDLSKYNHSCRPNAIYFSKGIRMTLVGLHDNVNVEDTENTFYSYIDLTGCTPVRRKLLADSWYFFCGCERCLDLDDDFCTSVYCPNCIKSVKVPGDEDLVKIQYSTVKLFNKKEPNAYSPCCKVCHLKLKPDYIQKCLRVMQKLNNIVETLEDPNQNNAVAQYQFLVDVANKFADTLSLSNSYMCNILAKLINVTQYVSVNNKLQIDLFEMTDSYCRYIFRYAHPSKAKLYLYIAQLHIALNEFNLAKQFAEEAKNIMEYVFGKKHYCYKEAKKCLHEINEKLVKAVKTTNVMKEEPISGVTIMPRSKYIARQVAIRKMEACEPKEKIDEKVDHSDDEMHELVED